MEPSPVTLARTTDPATSHAAAADASTRAVTVRARVHALFQAAPDARDGLTHDQLIALYRKYQARLGWPPASDSGIRTRCRELVRDGLVEEVRDAGGQSRFGRAALVWRAVPVQRTEADE
jgi:hypothetical protein